LSHACGNPTEAPEVKSHDLCPYGNVNYDGKPNWNANSADADDEYVAAFLMR
jgi:hypothetical protein